MSTEKVSIPSGEDEDFICSLGAYRVLESYGYAVEKETVDSVKRMMKGALTHYPELAGKTVNVGVIPDTDFAYARAFVKNWFIALPAYEDGRRPVWDLVYHELAHIAIEVRYERGEDVPHTSEEYCSLFALSRMPDHRIERDDIDYIGEPSVPKEEWPGICERALGYREDHHNYIQKAREWLGVGAGA